MIYDAVLRDIADKLAPVHTVRRRPGRPTPWFNDECRAERRNCRRLERRYRRTQRAEDRRLWVDAARRRLRLNRAKYEEYWVGRLPLYECNLVAVEGLECLYDPKSYAGGRVISW